MNALAARLLTSLSLVIAMALPLVSQPTSPDGTWSDVSEALIPDKSNREIIPIVYRTLSLNHSALQLTLQRAPMEWTAEAHTQVVTLDLPLPNGEFSRFRIQESPIMAPELAARYANIRTYNGQALDNRALSVRFDLTPAGFHAMIFTPYGTVYIDPYSRGDIVHYVCYYKHHLLADEARRFIEEGPIDDVGSSDEIARLVERGVAPSGTHLRTYRLALATTGEYTIFHGGTVPAGMAAVVTAMNRVNGIYEREVAVRMVLIPNNDILIYTDPATDPYTNSSGSTMLGQNQSNLDNVIGNANYDVGHVFSTGGGGIAGLGVVCRTGNKARGVTGLPSPIGDPFYVDYVAHEMGHQFGANHTFNGNAGSCSGNRSAANAYEPGSGSTIMAYAGICGSQNLQPNSDDYFHLRSIIEIVAYTTSGSGNGCPVTTVTGNNPPVVMPGSGGFTIPINTPFALTGSASDPESDPLTFCWEEYDLGPAGHPNSPSGTAPIFRSFLPATSPTRTFPKLSDLLNNTQTIGEILPSYGRTLMFRLTARDNRAGGGGVGYAEIGFSATASAGPFLVTSPNTFTIWSANTQQTITWNVANTNASPVSCPSVNILLSTNGGQTFDIALASGTPNDGSETVTVPLTPTTAARIRVEAANNIFFDISNVNFTISSLGAPVLVSPPDNATSIPVSTTLRWSAVSGATVYRLQVSTDSTFAGGFVVNDSTIVDTSRAVSGLASSTRYFWRVNAKNASGNGGFSPVWRFTTMPPLPAAVQLVSPIHDALIRSDSALLVWRAATPAVVAYWLEWSADSMFSSSSIDSTITDTTAVLYALNDGSSYWWRVRAKNILGWGAFSAARKFRTLFDVTVCFPVVQGWNMFSSPVVLESDSIQWPIQCPFRYVPGGGYQQACHLAQGMGYWLKLPNQSTFCLVGSPVYLDTVAVAEGWNLIGSISVGVPVSSIITIPSGIIQSDFFGYDGGGYSPVDTIASGRAFWVRVDQPGVIILQDPSLANSPGLARSP